MLRKWRVCQKAINEDDVEKALEAMEKLEV
jgi:hypothetical protein